MKQMISIEIFLDDRLGFGRYFIYAKFNGFKWIKVCLASISSKHILEICHSILRAVVGWFYNHGFKMPCFNDKRFTYYI